MEFTAPWQLPCFVRSSPHFFSLRAHSAPPDFRSARYRHTPIHLRC